MTKALPRAMKPGVAFPWGLLVINIIEEIVEEEKK
jgi:hypothetical protein